MLDDSSIRLLAAAGTGLLLGAWVRKNSAERLRMWEENPVGAREKAVRVAGRTAGPAAYVAGVLICVLIVVFVEVVVTFVRSVGG